MLNCARVGPAAAGDVQLIPPWHVPVSQFPDSSHPVRGQIRPLYPSGNVTVRNSFAASSNPPSSPPLAAGNIPGQTLMPPQAFTIVTFLDGKTGSQHCSTVLDRDRSRHERCSYDAREDTGDESDGKQHERVSSSFLLLHNELGTLGCAPPSGLYTPPVITAYGLVTTRPSLS